MLCTRCNHPVRPVVALDVDGTMAVYHPHFIEFAGKWFGKEFSLDYSGSVSLAQYLGVSLEEYRQCKAAYRQGGNKRFMPTYAGVRKVNRLLREMGVEVWVTTTRPYLRFDSTDPDTREWLRRNEIHYEGLLYDDDKYDRLLEIVGADRVVAVVEDDPEQYDIAEALGLHPLLIARPHNRFPRLTEQGKRIVVPSFELAERIIRQRVIRWRETHRELA